jgi:hypothetical protein
MKPEHCYKDEYGNPVRVIGRGDMLIAAKPKPADSFHVILTGSGHNAEMAIRYDPRSIVEAANVIHGNLSDVGMAFRLLIEKRPIFRQYV